VTWQQVVATLAGIGGGAGLWLLLTPAADCGPATSPTLWQRARVFADGPGGLRVLGSAAAGVVVLVATRWVAVAVAVTLVVAAWPRLFGAAAEQRATIARLESLASWVEALRDTIASGRALPEAIPAASARATPALARPLQNVVSRMGQREPIEQVLRRLADDIADPVADQAIAALILNVRAQGRQLRTVLTALATSTRREVETRRAVEAERRSMRRGVQIIMAVTVAITVGMAVFSRDYAAPYSTLTGQLVLVLVVAEFVAGFAWMRRLSTYATPARFLHAHHTAPDAPRVSPSFGGLR